MRVAQGNGPNDRIGTRVTVRTIELRISTLQQTGTTTPGFVRFILLIDHQANGQVAASNTILQAAGFMSPRNLGQRKRFKILRDKTFAIHETSTGPNAFFSHWYIKLKKPLNVEYNGGITAEPSSIASNSILLLSIGSWTGAGAATQCSVSLVQSRIRYTDN